MALCKNGQGWQGILRSFVIHLVCWFSWFSCFAFAQFDISEGVTGSVNFPALGITCVANIAVFATSLVRGGLDLEIGARDVLNSVTRPKLKNINGIEHGRGLTTCRGEDLDSTSVVFLSNCAPSWSMQEFIKSNAPFVDCILLQFEAVTLEMCEEGTEHEHVCNCISIWTVEEITAMLARRMPGTLKLLPNSHCLLPCLTCLKNGCHQCNQEDLLRVEGPFPLEQSDEGYKLRESDSKVVSEILDQLDQLTGELLEKLICICIPMNDASGDEWTKLLMKSLRCKDEENRGVRDKALEALEGYLAGRRGGGEGNVQYNFFPFVAPRSAEVLINLLLTFWFRVDGFSSAMVARRTVRDYLVDSKGTGLAANTFLIQVFVKSDRNNTQVCQVLSFRNYFGCCRPLGRLSVRIIYFCTGFVNLLCSLGWAVFISFEGADGVDIISPRPSMAILVAIIAAIGTSVLMETGGVAVGNHVSPIAAPGFVPILLMKKARRNDSNIGLILYFTGLALEMVCIVAGSAVAGTLGIKVFGRWVYGALQILVWLRWVIGCYFLNDQNLIECFGSDIRRRYRISIYSSTFLLNAALAGVRCKWGSWPWKDNHLFSRKLLAP